MQAKTSTFMLVFLLLLFSCNEPKEKPVNKEPETEKETPVKLGDFNKKYEGEIGNKDIVMNLRMNGNVLHGYYYYKLYEENIKVKGKLDTLTNTFVLSEMNTSNVETAKFTGTINNDFTLSCQWKSNKKKQTEVLSVQLKPTADYFVWYKPFLPFHPVHVSALSDFEGTLKKVNLNKKPDLKGVIMYKDDMMLESEVAGYESDEEPLMRIPFFEYQYIGEYRGFHYLFITESGGGTGIFTEIRVVEEKNGVLSEKESIVAGDRCMGGLQSAWLKKNKLFYSQNVTGVDMYSINHPDSEHAPNLDGCAICCVAQAAYMYDLKRKKTMLLHYELEDTGYPLPEENSESDMGYLMQLLGEHVKKKGTRLKLSEWEKMEKMLADRVKMNKG